MTYNHTLTNQGNDTDTFKVTVDSSQGWAEVSPATTITLAPGASRQIVVSVRVPADAVDGSVDTTIVTAASQSDPDAYDTAIDTTTVVIEGWTVFLPTVKK